MLGKLLKHDFIATWKVPVILDAALIVLGIMTAGLTQTIPHLEGSFSMTLFTFSYLGFYYIGIIATNVVTLIFLVIRYYRNLYTSEGYLTFTLPVHTDLIVLSKVITGTVWLALCYFSTFVSVTIAGASFLKAAGADFSAVLEGITDVFQVFGFGQPGFTPILLLLILLTPIAAILSMYFSVSIGQLWQNHKVLGTVLCIIALYIANQFVTQFAMLGSGFWQMIGSGADADDWFARIYRNMLLIICITTMAQSVVYFLVCLVINRKKVNLN